MMKMLIRACLTSLALALPVQLHAGWDGIYAGLNLGRVRASIRAMRQADSSGSQG